MVSALIRVAHTQVAAAAAATAGATAFVTSPGQSVTSQPLGHVWFGLKLHGFGFRTGDYLGVLSLSIRPLFSKCKNSSLNN